MNEPDAQAGSEPPSPTHPGAVTESAHPGVMTTPEGTAASASFTVTPAPRAIPPTTRVAVMTVRSGARWFWWIAGLSAVNTAMHLAHADTQFVLGLGITGVADAVFRNHVATALVIDAVVIGYFWWVGLQAQRGKRWAFLAGLAVYVPDTLIYVAVQAWMPVAFHALVVYFIVRGWRALSALHPAPAPA